MSPRLLDNTKWLWCFLALYSGSWSRVGSVSVKTPPKTPGIVEAQAKFFQDFFSVQLSPYKMEFGHVCEDPDTWEQRYEKKDFKNHRDMGKVRWGDKHGGYGEHYWDLNHAGHADNHGHDDDGDDGSYKGHDSDDGSYKVRDDDPYDEPSEHQSTYNDEYNPDLPNSYEVNNRAKRHPKAKAEKKDNIEEVKTLRQKAREDTKKGKQESDDTQAELHSYKGNLRFRPKELNYDDDQQNPNTPTQTPLPAQPEAPYVPYESGAGVRQHQPAEVPAAAASVPRLFLEPSTGHVVDRATGQAYVLQPIVANYQ